MVPFPVTFSDPWPRFQGHGVIFMPIDALSVLCAQLTRDLLATAKFLLLHYSSFKFCTQLGFATSLPKIQRLGPKLAGVWARGASRKIWDPLLISATVEASNFIFGIQLRFGTSLPKNNVLDQNWRGSGPREHPNKIWNPYVLQPLKLTTSNVVHKLALGLA